MPTPDFNSQLFAGTSQAISAGNAIAQSNINKSTRRWNEMMYSKQRADALHDWEAANAYNSPEAQMARLKAAGLNPNLVYGNGADAQSSGSVRSSDTGSWKPEAPQIGTQGLSMMYDLEMKNAQISNMEKQSKVLEMDAILRGAQVLQTSANTNMSTFQLQQLDRLKDVAYDTAVLDMNLTDAKRQREWQNVEIDLDRNEREAAMNASNLREAAERILRMRSQNATDQKQRAIIDSQIRNLGQDSQLKQWEIDLNNQGMQKGDPMWMRMLLKLLTSGGSNSPL